MVNIVSFIFAYCNTGMNPKEESRRQNYWVTSVLPQYDTKLRHSTPPTITLSAMTTIGQLVFGGLDGVSGSPDITSLSSTIETLGSFSFTSPNQPSLPRGLCSTRPRLLTLPTIMARPNLHPQRRLTLWYFCLFLPYTVRSLASLRTVDESRQRFASSFRSPSGKLTYVPELVLPETTDATGLLLHSNAVQTLSKRLRACQAHAALVKASLPTLQLLVQEQESARGAVPGPVPLICSYEAVVTAAAVDGFGDGDGNGDLQSSGVQDVMARIAAAGVDGVLVTANNDGRSLALTDLPAKTGDDGDPLASDAPFVEACRAALEYGLQPIPELVFAAVAEGSTERQDSDVNIDDVTHWIDAVARILGTDPVCVVVTMQPPPVATEEEDTVAGSTPASMDYPRVSKKLGRRCPVVGSVRSPAGDNRIGCATAALKEAGYTCALLRNECVPVGSSPGRTLDLEVVGQFWASCIDDLRSVKSKSFAFRSKNNLEKKAATVWSNYQSNVIESGALGDPNESYSVVDSAAGDYQGFA